MTYIKFVDGSTIETNISGNLYAGDLANRFGHVIRRGNLSLSGLVTIVRKMEKLQGVKIITAAK